jgi:TPR repeat protein
MEGDNNYDLINPDAEMLRKVLSFENETIRNLCKKQNFASTLKEASTGNMDAQYAVGMSYSYCLSGNSSPSLGVLYYCGRNFLSALEWFRKAAKQGSEIAAQCAGISLFN